MRRTLPMIAAAVLSLGACDEQVTEPAEDASASTALFQKAGGRGVPVDQTPVPMDMSAWNDRIAASGQNVAIAYLEYLTIGDADGVVGRTVFASDRGNKQLSADWVPNDERRGFGTAMPFFIDEFDGAATNLGAGLTPTETSDAIKRAMATWDGASCSTLPVIFGGAFDFDVGFVQNFFGFGGTPGFVPTLVHAGWLPGAFFDLLAPGGSEFILGVTFTLSFTDENGSPTDEDGNGKTDVATREIYYNDAFNWAIDELSGATNTFDVETVALHEAGHGLSQAHFGDIFVTNLGEPTQSVHFAPFAVMNAAISRIAQDLEGTDLAGHCSNWGDWPNG